MADQHCRVTVVGQHKRVDLAVPARAPIAEYVGGLADLCWAEDDEAMPAAWTLAQQGGRPLAPSASLADAGVIDGQILYLRDATDGEYHEPVVLDVEELVDEAANQIGGPRWDGPVRAAAALTIGVLWLVAAPLLAMFGGASSSLPGLLALSGSLLLPLIAWTARRNGWPVGPVPQQIMALAAVPSLAVAAWFLLPRPAPDLVLVWVALGALVGALIALIAAPRMVVLAIQLLALVGTLMVAVLAWVSATGIEMVAAVAVVGYALLCAAPWVVGHLIAHWPVPDRESDDPEASARADVLRGRHLLVVWNALAAAATGAMLIVLATSTNTYAPALAGCLCVALFRRLGGYHLLVESLPVALAASAGFFTLLVRLPMLLSELPPGFGVVLSWLLGSLAVVVGLAFSFRRESEPMARNSWLRIVAALCAIASVPLMLGVFGVLDQLFALGKQF